MSCAMATSCCFASMSEARTGKAGRIQLIDALRGLSIVLMVAYHTGFDLVSFRLIPEQVLYNPLLNLLEPIFAGLFIVLSGVSARYARSNQKRGLQVLGCALVISLATGAFGMPIYFGILHCLGMCMVLCGNPATWVDKIPRHVQPFLFLGLFALCKVLFPLQGPQYDAIPYAYLFGMQGEQFLSYDYFPLLPWFFLYPFGAWVGTYIQEGRFPRWFYDFRMPLLPVIGRHTLLIYMLHQPVIFGVLSLLSPLLTGD